MSDNNTHALDLIQTLLAAGDIDGVRKAILELEPEDHELLSEDLGEQGYRRVIRSARARRRARKKGRVIMLHGITGSMLESVDGGGDADRIWINPWTLARGRIDELKLNVDGSPADPGYQIRTNGMHRKTYLPMILELDQSWHVHPFEYDWRHNIDVSADRLAQTIQEFRRDNEPVHLVAHSMGGLVSRCFIQRHPEVWASMRDPDNPSTGGRLIMLGTPNYGAFSIVQALTGQEKMLKILAFLDFDHNKKELLEILNTFQGSYQMLPSPLVELDDDHKLLFDPDSWGACPMIAQHLAEAKRFHAEMSKIVDPERFIYVAGYNQKTPVKIEINDRKSGKFKFLISRDGDGRVPHKLGLLPNVPTFWIDEVHGSLPKNETVLAAIDELLVSGKSSRLEKDKPASRRGAEEEWVTAEEMYEIPSDIVNRMQLAGKRQRGAATENLSPSDQIEIESLLADGFLARAEPASRAPKGGKGRSAGRKTPKEMDSDKVPSISVEVVWGDITRADGDVYVVGHYQGVLPQNAEWALDLAVSGQLGMSYEDLQDEDVVERQIIRQHTRRGSIKSGVGEVTYFPWGHPDARERNVAVVGMGRIGSFGLPVLTRLIRDATLTISLLPCVNTICMVLIGAGEGSLRPEESVNGLVRGVADALESGHMQNGLQKIKIVERNRNRSEEILQALRQQAEQPGILKKIRLDVKKTLTKGPGGVITTPDALEMVIDAAARAMSKKNDLAQKKALDSVLSGIRTKKSREAAEEALKAYRDAQTAGGNTTKKDYGVTEKSIGADTGQVTRISCLEEGGVIRIAAITNTTTMAERQISPSPDFIQDIVDQTNDPDQEPMENFSSFLTRLLFPKDFRELLAGDQFVFEVDRTTAQIHWEMLAPNLENSENEKPLGASASVARQLRTRYSAVPFSEHSRHGPLKALIIGDPGSVKKQYDLPGARQEALAVRDILQKCGVEVTALIGSSDGSRDNIPSDVLPATRMAALNLLMHGDYDLLHYSGHGDFDPEAPDQVGWVFERGLLTAHEIRSIDDAPGLIVANACLSGRTSETLTDERQVRYARSEAGLLPSLADEFFRLGAGNYIGTSWEVNDIGAVLFAREFYSQLLSAPSDSKRPTVGEAMREARLKLYENRDLYGKLWAAYQHYGDPASRVRRT